jgi:hypothetical protein
MSGNGVGDRILRAINTAQQNCSQLCNATRRCWRRPPNNFLSPDMGTDPTNKAATPWLTQASARRFRSAGGVRRAGRLPCDGDPAERGFDRRARS